MLGLVRSAVLALSVSAGNQSDIVFCQFHQQLDQLPRLAFG